MADKDALARLEYQTAQDSAQHHDQLIWTTTGILWSGTLILLGFVLNGLASDKHRIALTVISVLGLFLVITVWRFMWIWREVRNRKYAVCKRLETEFPFTVKHHCTEGDRYPSCTMTTWYSVVSVVFIVIWVLVVVNVWWEAMP